MKVLDSFFTLDNNTLSLNPQSEIYAAHFPGYPITPGVCLIQAVAELASKQLSKDLTLSRITNVKFLKVLSPNEYKSVEVELNIIEKEPNQYSVKSRIFNGDVVFAQISLVLNA